MQGEGSSLMDFDTEEQKQPTFPNRQGAVISSSPDANPRVIFEAA